MKGYIPQEKLGEIKSRVNIVDLISGYVTLKKAGRNFIGLCPFHKEKTPSFSVNPEKQIFYCFGCGEGGDIFAFLMKINGTSFAESARQLADKAGISLPVGEMTREEKGKETEREKLGRVNAMAADFFSSQLTSSLGRAARDYLHMRKMDSQIVDTFHLGYAPQGWNSLATHLEGKGVPLGLAERAGLVVSKGNNRFYDRFRDRVIFPIEDLAGRVVAFGGRAIGSDMPKYLNSPESPVYIKGRVLYGLSRTKEAIRDSDYVVLVEGYIDFLSLWNAGIKNVVATLGTALTREQVELIRRFTRNVAIIFDPDDAGRHAVERSLRLFLEESMHARVVVLPDGYDPDDYVKEYGPSKIWDVIASAPMMVDYYIDAVMGGGNTLEDQLDITRDAVSFISTIGDPVERDLFMKRVSERLGVDQILLRDRIEKVSSVRKGSVSVESEKKKIGRVDIVELNLIYMMMEYPEKIPVVKSEGILDFFDSEELKSLGNRIIEERGDAASMVTGFENGPVKQKLLKLMMERPFSDKLIIDRVFDDNIGQVRKKWYRGKGALLKRELIMAQNKGDRALSDRLLRDRDRLLKEERGLAKNEKSDQVG